MAKKVVLIKVEDCLMDYRSQLIEAYRREIDPEFKLKQADMSKPGLRQYFPGVSVDRFTGKHAEEIFLGAKPYEKDTAAVIESLRKDYKVVLWTDLGHGAELLVPRWLGKEHVSCDGLIFEEAGPSHYGFAALDDRVEDLELFKSRGMVAVCLDRAWNIGRSGLKVWYLSGLENVLKLYSGEKPKLEQ